jgi:hypothetical protein
LTIKNSDIHYIKDELKMLQNNKIFTYTEMTVEIKSLHYTLVGTNPAGDYRTVYKRYIVQHIE